MTDDVLLCEINDESLVTSYASVPSGELCHVCNIAIAIYQCPRCSICTCSLPCVNNHKKENNCTGRKDAFAITAVPSDINDEIFKQDIRYLDRVSLEVERSSRWTAHNNSERFETMKGALSGYVLRKMCEARGINIVLCPPELSLRRRNTTQLTRRHKKIAWRIEWRFFILKPDGTKTMAIYSDKTIVETTLVRALVERFWHMGGRTPRQIPSLSLGNRELHDMGENPNDWGILIQDFVASSDDPVWQELNRDLDIMSALKGKTVYEFPVFHIVNLKDYGIAPYKKIKQ